MKLPDIIILSLAVAFLIMGIHQVMTVGFQQNYYIFMLAIGMLMWFQLRRIKAKENKDKDG